MTIGNKEPGLKKNPLDKDNKPKLDGEEEIYSPTTPRAAQNVKAGKKVQIGIEILETTKQRLAIHCAVKKTNMTQVINKILEDFLHKEGA